MNNTPFLTCNHLYKDYTQGDNTLNILQDINLTVNESEIVSIIGSSGSGKSTLLHILAGLDQASKGEIKIDNKNLAHISDNELCAIRNNSLGFIYQFHHLLPEFTALENVLMPMRIANKLNSTTIQLAKELLDGLGLNKRFNHFPGQLSGGEKQRVAIARAMINSPKIIFADEPTGNLDNQTSHQVLQLLLQLQQQFKTSLIIVTHDNSIARVASRQYHLENKNLLPLN